MKSVAELAAERRLASTAAKPAAVAIGESNSRKSSDTVAGCPRLQLTRSEYEIARANEREREKTALAESRHLCRARMRMELNSSSSRLSGEWLRNVTNAGGAKC